MTALSQGGALLFLFVVLPLILGLAVAWFVQRRSEPFPDELRTSSILRDGAPARATLVGWKTPAQSFLDRHPMVTFTVRLDDGREIEIVQAVPRADLRSLETGQTLDLRVGAGGQGAAIVFA